jgi:UDP-N-acetylmuramoyl-L-alanyl-D-glutamate--2,6-diaminopimelate ligase
MKIKKLFKNLPVEIRPGKDIDITGLSNYSKKVVPGHLFIARKGMKQNGQEFIDEAISNGAQAIFCSHYNPFLRQVVQIIHPFPEKLEAQLACRFYENPSDSLLVYAFTGTSAKTTCSSILQQLLNSLSIKSGYIGTFGYDTGKSRYDADHTTPDTLTFQRLLREMVTSGCKACTLEASSHGLNQGRLDGVKVDVGIFTNLAHDHLDYHGDMSSYARAKAKLFDPAFFGSKLKTAIVNIDDPHYLEVTGSYKGPIVTYGKSMQADLRLISAEFKKSFTNFQFIYKNKLFTASTKLIGEHNALNLLAILAALLTLDESNIGLYLEAIKEINPVRGRLEKITPTKAHVYIDYAHKPDSLKHVLQTLRQVHPLGKLITVFGCGGDRDHIKRPMMGKIATELSDHTIITNDNPRSESAKDILDQILQGCSSLDHVEIELDRKSAIFRALSLAQPNDIVLVAGKGDESYQIIGSRMIPFDDAQVVREWHHAKC